MNSNTHSASRATRPSVEPAAERPAERVDRLASLSAAAKELAVQDLNRLTDAALAEQVLALRRLLDGLEGQWLRGLAAVDARRAAGADQDQQVGSTAAWLRTRLRLGPAPPPAVSGPPGPCSVAPWPRPPRR
jgi:hypothetical protein